MHFVVISNMYNIFIKNSVRIKAVWCCEMLYQFCQWRLCLSVFFTLKLCPVSFLVWSELSHQRQVYLYSKIRPFCPDYAKDILCHIPDTTDNSEFEPAVPEPVEATAAATGSTTKGSELSDQTELAPVTRQRGLG